VFRFRSAEVDPAIGLLAACSATLGAVVPRPSASFRLSFSATGIKRHSERSADFQSVDLRAALLSVEPEEFTAWRAENDDLRQAWIGRRFCFHDDFRWAKPRRIILSIQLERAP